MKYKNPVLALVMTLSVVTLSTVSAGEVGIGLAAIHFQPPQEGAESESNVVPVFFYEGENFHVGLGEVSYDLFKSRGFSVQAMTNIRFESYQVEGSPALQGMSDRNVALDMGLSANFEGNWGTLSFAVVGDVTGTYDGSETRFMYRLPIPVGKLVIEPSLGMKWKSKELVDYYYGVRPTEATAQRPAYTGKSTANAMFGLTFQYEWDRKWFVIAGLEYEKLGEHIKNSPIINTDHQSSFFSAVFYRL